MSQIDKLNFIPHLFWFLVLFFLFYFFIFSYILPLIYQSLKVRELFLTFIINESLLYDIFYSTVTIVYSLSFFRIFGRTFVNFFKSIRNINNIRIGFYLKNNFSFLKVQ